MKRSLISGRSQILQHTVCYYVKCVENAPFRKPGHKCCLKIIRNWTIVEIDSEDSVEHYFSHMLSSADIQLEGHALIDVHVGKDKNDKTSFPL